MSFTPTLSRASESAASSSGASEAAASSSAGAQGEVFVARVSYKAKGLDPSARYKEPSYRQLQRGTLTRPFAAAEGILPVYDTKKTKGDELAD